MICRNSSYKWTFLKINKNGITTAVAKIVPKKILVSVSLKIFFSVKGINKIPNKIIVGSLTINQIGMYVEGKFFEYINLPYVLVPTLLKWLDINSTISKNNAGFNHKGG